MRGMLYAATIRNSASSTALWGFWDSIAIAEHTLIGYWEPDAATSVALARSTLARGSGSSTLQVVHAEPPAPAPYDCMASWKETEGKYARGDGTASGDIGFGTSCGPPRPFDYPPMTVEAIKQKCCDLGSGCYAFSWAKAQDPATAGEACARKTPDGGYTVDAKYNGYEKVGPPSPSCADASAIKATTYVKFGESAMVVVASWCTHPAQVQLTYDWAQLGFGGPGTKGVAVTQPAIDRIQDAVDHGDGSKPFTVTSVPNGGAILWVVPV